MQKEPQFLKKDKQSLETLHLLAALGNPPNQFS
jgi:hypothetical protein